MEEASNEASWSQARQARQRRGRIDRGRDPWGWRGRGGKEKGERGVRHAGCMATQAALLYQETPVGPFPPELC